MEILTAIGGGLLGGILRLIPEFLKLFTLKRDQDHEFRMTKMQQEIDKDRSQHRIDETYAGAGYEAIKGEMVALSEALKSQGQMTGVKWVDGLNQSVRPIVTYWWMALFTLVKAVFLVVALVELWINLKSAALVQEKIRVIREFGNSAWTSDDAATLSMILGFWFVDRAMKYIKRA